MIRGMKRMRLFRHETSNHGMSGNSPVGVPLEISRVHSARYPRVSLSLTRKRASGQMRGINANLPERVHAGVTYFRL